MIDIDQMLRNVQGKEFNTDPEQLKYFKDGKATLNYKLKHVSYHIDVQLKSRKIMTVTDIRLACIVKVA